MTLQDDAKKLASENKVWKWVIVALALAGTVFLFSQGKPDDARKVVEFVNEIISVSQTAVMPSTDPVASPAE